MKFVLTFTVRHQGSAADNAAGTEATLKLLASWQPSPDHTIHQWVNRCDGNGGFCVLDTDNAAAMYKDIAVWTPLLDFRVYPVLDIGESTPLLSEASGITKSAV